MSGLRMHRGVLGNKSGNRNKRRGGERWRGTAGRRLGAGLERLEERRLLSISIDAAWLAAQSTAPYVLSASNETYVLQTDVTVAGSAFVVTGKNVVLDLNGHTVTYANRVAPMVANGGFETGTIGSHTVLNWDVSGASSAAIASNTNYLFGNQVLRLSNFSTTQTIISDPIAIPEANYTYEAIIIPGGGGDAGTSIKISVIDATDGTVLVQPTALPGLNVNRGQVNPIAYRATTTHAVRLKIDVTPASGVTTTVDLDHASLMRTFDYGIIATVLSGSDFPGFSNLPSSTQSLSRRPENFTVKNGVFTQGQYSYASTFLVGNMLGYFGTNPAGGLTVDNVTSNVQGMDARGVMAMSVYGGITIRNSTFHSSMDAIGDRMHSYGSFGIIVATILATSDEDILIDNNHMDGTGQMGIVIWGGATNRITVSNNDIRQVELVPNSYAMAFYSIGNFQIVNNTIVTDNGRGLFIDEFDGGSSSSHDGDISGNYIDIQEKPNRELANSAANALRMRNNETGAGAFNNIRIHDNTIISRAGAGTMPAMAARLSFWNDGRMDDAGIVFDNNTFKAITSSASVGAEAFVLDRAQAGINMVVKGNVFESNDTSLRILQSDGGSDYDTLFLSNIFRKNTADAPGVSVSYKSILCGYWVYEAHNIRFIDNKYENGATTAITWIGEAPKDIALGWLLGLTVKNGSGVVLSGAAVTVLDKSGATVFSGVTGADGRVSSVLATTNGGDNITTGSIPLIAAIYNYTYPPGQVTTDTRTPLQLQVSLAGYNASTQSLALTQSQDLTVTLLNGGPGVQITQSGGSTTVTEGGATDSYTVALSTQPTANVTVTITPGGQVSVDKTSLVFTTANWNTAQTVTVTAVNDSIVEGAHTGTITHAVTSADANYNGLSVGSVTAQITDNDTVGVQITQSGGSTTVTEGGATDSYTVAISTQPTANVTVTITSGGQVSVDKTSLVFTTANWNTAQTVTVTAVNDSVVEGAHTGTITHAVTSADANYNGLSVGGVTAQITDNDTVGVRITQSGGSTTVTEGGATDSYTVALATQPTANVTVTITSGSQVSVDKTSLVFTTANWNTAQTVTVTAVNDSIVEGAHTGTITHAVTSADANYNGLSVGSVTAQITDNDTVGVQITQSGGSTTVTEGGATDSYTVVLSTQPTANVTVTITSGGQVSVDKTSLVFTTANWNTAQTVTVTAVNDSVVEGAHTGTITHAVTSADANYNGLSVGSVTAQITDNDTVGVQITQSGGSTTVTEGGATDSYTVVLSTQPTANVTVTITSGGQVSVDKTSLVFTTANWNTAQTVTVTAVNDSVVEGAHTGTITHAVTSADANYNGLSVGSVTAQITDNDTVGGQYNRASKSNDFNGDGTSDVLWQNQTNGVVGSWLIKNGVYTDWANLGGADLNVWKVVGVGDFNGDGTSDVLWQNQTNGVVGSWLIKNGVYTDWADLGGADPNVWKIVGVGDCNGDGTSDVLWQNQTNGVVGSWLIKNGVYTDWANLGSADPNVWKVVGVGDFNGDGTSDVLWQNQTNGVVGSWLIKNGVYTDWANLGGADPNVWKIVGVAISTGTAHPTCYGRTRLMEWLAPGL